MARSTRSSRMLRRRSCASTILRRSVAQSGIKASTPTSIIAMMAHQITLIPGDGIGPEVADATVRAVEATGVADRMGARGRRRAGAGRVRPVDSGRGLRLAGSHARGPQGTHHDAHRRRAPEHQRGVAQEAGALRQFPPGSHAAGPQDAVFATCPSTWRSSARIPRTCIPAWSTR